MGVSGGTVLHLTESGTDNAYCNHPPGYAEDHQDPPGQPAP